MSALSRVRTLGQVALSVATQIRVDSIMAEARHAASGLWHSWLRPEERARLAGTKGIYHRVVWAPPQDALADGWATHTGDEQDATAEIDRDLGVEWALLEARAAARQDGGAWLWPVTDDDDWSEPLGDGPHEVAALHVLTQIEVTPLSQEHDPLSPSWGRPALLSVHARRDGLSFSGRIHASRLIYVPGAPSTPSQRTPHRCYDLPVLELYRDALEDYDRAASKVGRLLERLSMPWVRLKEGHAAAAGDDPNDPNGYTRRLELLKVGMGGPGLMAVLGEDEVGWTGPSLTGVRDGINVLAERICAVEGYPLTYWLGQPPGGLSTDDASGKRSTHAGLSGERRLLSDVLGDLYDLLLGPGEREIVWPSLDKPTALEETQISLARAQRDALLIDRGVIDWTEARARFAAPEELPAPVVHEEDAEGLPGMGEPTEAAEVEPEGEAT